MKIIILVIFSLVILFNKDDSGIDFVFTWVNGTSDEHRSNGLNRFRDNDELKYSLRSIEKYAPWFRNVFIVTNGDIPNWLNLTNPKIKMIHHKDIFSKKSDLPTYNSAAIEFNLHKIPGISKKFLYFNDDMLLLNNVTKEDFIINNKYKIYQSYDVPDCNNECNLRMVGDGYCDTQCMTESCFYDGNDCYFQSSRKIRKTRCSDKCMDEMLGDGKCNIQCNKFDCGFDLGDCGEQDFKKFIYTLHQSTEVEYLNNVKFLILKMDEEIKEVIFDQKLPIRKAKFIQNQLFISFQNYKDDLNIIITLKSDKKIILKMNSKLNAYRNISSYASSLMFTSFIFNMNIKTEDRKVVPHMVKLKFKRKPIMISKEVMESPNIQNFQKFIDDTISSKHRTTKNLQFQFFYTNFLKYYHKHKIDSVIQNSKLIEFIQIENNEISLAKRKFEELKNTTSKFLCINDNLDNSNSFSQLKFIHEFLNFYFPFPSSFENVHE
jgi:hypothetical protein